MIETLAENYASAHGYTADMGYWLSSSLTSIRESKSVFRQQSGRTSSSESGISAWVAQRQALAVQEQGSQLSKAELLAQYKAEQRYNQRQDVEQMGNFKKLVNSKAFKILSLAIPSMFFGGFSLIGAVQIATAFGSKIISAPKTISQYRTTIHAIKDGVRQAASIKLRARAAGVSPQVFLEQQRKLTKYPMSSPRTVTRVNPNPMLVGVDISVEDFVNSELEPFNPALAYAPITSTVTYATAQSVANLEAQVELLKYQNQIELLKYQYQTLEELSSVKDTASNIEENMQGGLLGDRLSVDASPVAEVYDPRTHVISWSFKAQEDQLRLDLPTDLTLDEGTQWFKYQHRIPSDKKIGILVKGLLLRLNIEFKGIDDKIHKIEKNTKLHEILEWMGYSLSEEIYLVELDASGKISTHSGYRVQLAKEISESKWRYWTDKSVSQISASKSSIDKEFPNFKKFKELWGYLYKDNFNFLQMAFSYEDVKAFSDLYTYMYSLSTEFLKDNLEIIDKGQFNPQKLEDIFKTGYFYNVKFASPDKMAELLEGKPPADHAEIRANYRTGIDEIYDVIFAPGFTDPNIGSLTVEQSMYTILDIIMRNVVFIQEKPESGGSGLYDVAPRVREFLISPVQDDLKKLMLSPNGRYLFFEKFSEMFFGRAYSDISLAPALSNLKGRELESLDCVNDFADSLIAVLGASKFVAFINGMNYGRVSLTSTLSKLGLNYYIEKYGSLDANERLMFKFPITAIRNLLTESDRSFIDIGGALITEDTIFFREAKNSASFKAMTWSARRDVANDLMRDAFMGVQIELPKFQSGTDNVLLKNLRNIVLTATAASRDGPSDLTAILNNMARRSRFKDFRSGSSLKFPAIYTHLYSCADELNFKLEGKTFNTKQQAIAELQSYIASSGEFLSNIKKLARLAYTNAHFIELTDGYFESIEDYFLHNLQNLVIPSSDGSGFKVSLKERVSLLFKKMDIDGTVKLKVSDLPADLMLFEGGQWIKLTDKFDGNHEMDAAYIVVHDVNTKVNGIMKIDSVINNLPNGIEEGYFDIATGNVYSNILVSDAYGNYLFSRIDLSTFEARKDGWYTQFTDTNGLLQKEMYVVFGLTSSNQYLCFLFNALVRINPKEIYKEYLPGISRLNKPKNKLKYDYIITDKDPIYAGLDMLDLKVRAVCSIVYQFDKLYLSSASRKGNNPIGATPVLLPDSFLNLYPHETLYYSLNRFSKVFEALGLSSQQLKEIVPISIFEPSPLSYLTLSPNALYSPKQFYNVFHQSLVSRADDLRTQGLIDDKIYDEIQSLGAFSDLYLNNLNDQQINIEESDRLEIELLNSILTDLFGYSGYTLLKSGFMSIKKSVQGYQFVAFAPDKEERTNILRRTYMFSIKSSSGKMQIITTFFKFKEDARLFFIDLLINGHKQSFFVNGYLDKIKSKPQEALGNLLYPSSTLKGKPFNFLSHQYANFLDLFSKDTSSNLIVSGRNTILQGIYGMLEKAIPSALIDQEFPKVIDSIINNAPPTAPISKVRAIEIVRELVLSYYWTYYLDNIYVSGQKYDYILKIYQMIKDGTTQTLFDNTKNSKVHNFFNSFDFVFDLKNSFNNKELIDVAATVSFYYRPTYYSNDPKHLPAWSLRLNSIRSEVKDTTIKTFKFLQDLFNSYDPNVKHFSIFFHRQGVSGINHHTTLRTRISSKYVSDEIKGTCIDVDRTDPQSVIDAITSIVYYMQKYNAFVMIKEGFRSQSSNSIVVCFDQMKIYRPDIIQNLGSGSDVISPKFLSQFSEAHYNSWSNQYNDIFGIHNIYPIYLFHDENEFAQMIVDNLRIYLGVNAQIIKLQ